IASSRIQVVDATPRSLTVPADITAEATGPGGATVPFSVGATDIVDGPVTATCSPSSEFMFPLGTTRVDCTATDFHANAVTATFTITIRDTTPPIVTVPFPFSVEATGPTGVSGSGTDVAGNTAWGSFEGIVQDPTPPALTIPADAIAEATGPSGAVVSFVPSATDIVDGPVPVSCSPASGSMLPLGTTVVLCTATDAHGNSAT